MLTTLHKVIAMSQSNFNMRLDDDLKASAYSVIEQYGLTPTQAVRMFLNEIAHTKTIPLSLNWASCIPNAETAKLTGYHADELTDVLVESENG